jgi:regulator of replication initiation timing
MGHELIAEFCRAHELRTEFFRRCQRVFRDEVQPQLDERERLLEENADLRTENADLKTKLEALATKAAARRAEKVPA